MNFIQDSLQRFSQHFKSTFHWLTQVYCITQKIHISGYVCKTFLEELAFLKCRETFGKFLQLVAFLNAALPQVFFCHILTTVPKDFRSLPKFFISTSHFNKSPVPFNFMHVFRPNERCIFSTQQLVVKLLILPVVVKWWATPMQKKI